MQNKEHHYTIQRFTGIRITVVDNALSETAHATFQQTEGAFLSPEIRSNPENFFRAIAYKIEHGERIEIPGIIFRVEEQESRIKKTK